MATIGRRAANTVAGAYARGRAFVHGLDRPGYAGMVSPFEAGTVTPGAVALKSIASLIYGRRAYANEQAARTKAASDLAYRDMQMKYLQSRIDHPAGSGAAPHRTTLSAEAAKSLVSQGLMPQTWDPNTMSLPTADYSAASGLSGRAAAEKLHDQIELHRKALEGRLNKSALSVEARRKALTSLAGTAKMLASLNADEKAAGEEGGRSRQAQIDAAIAGIESPNTPEPQRLRYAQDLGLSPATTFAKGKTKATPLQDQYGRTLYDYSSPYAMEQFKRSVEDAKLNAAAMHRRSSMAKRAALESVYSQYAGHAGITPPQNPEDFNPADYPDQPEDTSIDDEQLRQLEEQGFQLIKQYAPQPAEPDTSEGGPDQEAR
jgi:hypothetical protein